MDLTLDSSTIVAALRFQEPAHVECRNVLDQLRAGMHSAIQPLTTAVEVAAAIRRRTGSEALALRIYSDLRAMRAFRLLEMDGRRADEAVHLAARLGLRGMDAIVVQICREFGTVLVSLDDEMVRRASGIIAVRSVSSF